MNDNNLSVDTYFNSPPLTFPIEHSITKLTITEIKGKCKRCDKHTVDLRGISDEWPNAIRVRAGGVCKPCALITYFEIRWGEDSLLHRSDDGWVRYPMQPLTLWRRFRKLIKL